MKKHTIIFLFLTIVFNSVAQTKIDTLIIGTKKYPLKKTNIYHLYRSGPVALPSEYQKIQNYYNGIMVKYKFSSDTIESIEDLDDGSQVWVKKPKQYKAESGGYFNLYSFLDTIKLTYKEFLHLKPYIKSNNSKTHFCASKVNHIYKDTLGEVTYINSFDGNIFSFWNSWSNPSEQEIEKLKHTVFIVRDLYYVRKNATYYLDREFIVVIK